MSALPLIKTVETKRDFILILIYTLVKFFTYIFYNILARKVHFEPVSSALTLFGT